MSKRKVLVVDDNLTICKLLSTRLAAYDFLVTIANNGPEGLQKAAQFAPDVILLDINMPEMDGIEVGMELKKSITTKNIPIIMLTAHGERTIMNLAMDRFKPDGYVVKPFNPDKLLEEINRVLEPKK